MPKTARSTPTFPHIHFNTIGNRWLEPTEPPIEEKLKKTLHCCWNCVGRRKPYTALGTVVGAQSSKLSTLPVNKLDESYTPSKVSIRAGDGFHNLKEIKTVELLKPTGWVYLSLSGVDPR
ncbi:hypothetical protein JHK84_035470 [Glycine max]|nr:hypothetical protein JHK84_035470 [Glycine max]